MKQHGYIILSIFLGGALGTLFRYLINLQVATWIFPMGTLIENLVGSFLLGILTGYILHAQFPPILKEGLGVGFCGGFTTMSTLAADTFFLAEQSNIGTVSVYLSVSLFGGIFLAFVGMALSTAFVLHKKKAGDVQ
ncbi:CrcB family protein [Evansella sp. AB-rgal1]|uniref:fluoride efflux transporter FluC n=1 Tax=Evansella sp. AB-rgal1 TaxID=3242696 RepID=UPI00359CD8C8